MTSSQKAKRSLRRQTKSLTCLMNIEKNSSWLEDSTIQKPLSSLKKDISVDIAIIGSGITGITTAYLLSKTKKSLAVLEKAAISQSISAYTTAFITFVIDTSLSELVSLY